MQTLKVSLLFCWVVVFSCAEKPSINAKRMDLGSAGTATAEKLKWMTLEEVAAGLKGQKRPILIDLYTDWCGWCKVMDKKTYTNPKVIAYLQEHFYPVKLNAETKETLSWNEKT